MKAGVGEGVDSPREMAGVGVATGPPCPPGTKAVAGAGAIIASGGSVRAATAVPRTGESDNIKQKASMAPATAETRRPATRR